MTVNIHTRTPGQDAARLRWLRVNPQPWTGHNDFAPEIFELFDIRDRERRGEKWTVDGEDIASDCFARRGTGLSRADFDFFFRLGAQVNIAPKQGWIML